MASTVVFDVNETLLDLEPVRRWFDDRFDGRPDASMWFAELLRLSFILAVTDRYTPFTDLAASALETVAARSEITVDATDMDMVRKIFVSLPAHADVVSGIDRLLEANLAVVALTNSPQSTAEAQLRNAGIADRFESIMSVEMVGRFKPHRSVYQAAARRLSIATSDIVMVAAHDWDVAGAIAAGTDGVFVARSRQAYSPALQQPTMIARDIDDAASMIIERYG